MAEGDGREGLFGPMRDGEDRPFEPKALDERVHGLTDNGAKDAVEMEWREMSQSRQPFERKRLVEMVGDKVHHAMDAATVDFDRSFGDQGCLRRQNRLTSRWWLKNTIVSDIGLSGKVQHARPGASLCGLPAPMRPCRGAALGDTLIGASQVEHNFVRQTVSSRSIMKKNRRAGWLAAALVIAAAWHSSTCAGAQPKRQSPNVLLIVVDDMGYGDLGCYGSKQIRTPSIDGLAKEGVRLTNYYANGALCSPTRAAF